MRPGSFARAWTFSTQVACHYTSAQSQFSDAGDCSVESDIVLSLFEVRLRCIIT